MSDRAVKEELDRHYIQMSALMRGMGADSSSYEAVVGIYFHAVKQIVNDCTMRNIRQVLSQGSIQQLGHSPTSIKELSRPRSSSDDGMDDGTMDQTLKHRKYHRSDLRALFSKSLTFYN